MRRPISTGCSPERNRREKNPSTIPSRRCSICFATPTVSDYARAGGYHPLIALVPVAARPAGPASAGRVVERQTRWLQVPVRVKRVGVQIPPRPPSETARRRTSIERREVSADNRGGTRSTPEERHMASQAEPPGP